MNSGSLKGESINDFDKQVENSLLTFGEERFKKEIQKESSPFQIQITRSPQKKLSYHSPLLARVQENRNNNDTEENKSTTSQKSFQSRHLLRIDTQAEIRKESQSVSPTSAFSMEKALDFYELNLFLDSMKCYKYYFPHNNANVVIQKINYENHKVLSEKKTIRRKNWRKTQIISSKISEVNSMNEIKSARDVEKEFEKKE